MPSASLAPLLDHADPFQVKDVLLWSRATHSEGLLHLTATSTSLLDPSGGSCVQWPLAPAAVVDGDCEGEDPAGDWAVVEGEPPPAAAVTDVVVLLEPPHLPPGSQP